MRIPDQGRAAGAVLAELDERRAADVDYERGRLFAYVFLPGEEARRVAEQAYFKYLWSNTLDPLAFPSLLRMEQEIVAMSADHLGAGPEASGNLTTGGTESVMLAVRAARSFAQARSPAVERFQIILPVTAHPCFHKAAACFGLETVVTPVDPRTLRADAGAMRRAITDRTALLVGSAPSYAHGVIDPIEEIAALAKERGLLCHVDGCVGAFLLPFFRELGSDIPPFDFQVPGVTSISMDFHKYAMTPKGASLVLYRDTELHRHQIFTWSDWTGYPVINPTLPSSKNGGPIAATWALLHHLGRAGYKEVTRALRDGARRAREGVAAIKGLRILGDPPMSLLAIAGEGIDVFRLSEAMGRRGWTMGAQLQCGEIPANLHLTIMPNSVPQLDDWLADLSASVEEVRAAAPTSRLAPLAAMAGQIDLGALRGKDLQGLLEMVGLGGDGALGDALGEVNGLLDTLAPAQRDALLKAFYELLTLAARRERGAARSG